MSFIGIKHIKYKHDMTLACKVKSNCCQSSVAKLTVLSTPEKKSLRTNIYIYTYIYKYSNYKEVIICQNYLHDSVL